MVIPPRVRAALSSANNAQLLACVCCSKLSYQAPGDLALCSRLTVMDSAKGMLMRAEGGQVGTLSAKTGSNSTEATGDMRKLPDKSINQNSLSPVSYSQNLVDDATMGQRSGKYGDVSLASKPSAPDRDLSDIPNKDASSSDAESDLYEEIDVSCTPESMDYPSGQGKNCGSWYYCLFVFIYLFLFSSPVFKSSLLLRKQATKLPRLIDLQCSPLFVRAFDCQLLLSYCKLFELTSQLQGHHVSGVLSRL